MTKLFCDRCGKELDYQNTKYVSLTIYDFADNDKEAEHWEFCHRCMSSIKHAMIKCIAELERTWVPSAKIEEK